MAGITHALQNSIVVALAQQGVELVNILNTGSSDGNGVNQVTVPSTGKLGTTITTDGAGFDFQIIGHSGGAFTVSADPSLSGALGSILILDTLSIGAADYTLSGANGSSITGSKSGDIAIMPKSGSKLGFFAATPIVQPATYGAVTDSTGGAPASSLTASTGTYNAGIVNNNFSTVQAELAAIRTALVNYGLAST